MEFIDAAGKVISFVAGRVAAPHVSITSFQVQKVQSDTWEATLSGTVRDPVGAVKTDAPRVVLTINGLSQASGVVLSYQENGVYTFATPQRIPLPYLLTEVIVRAENSVGAVGVASRLVETRTPDGQSIEPYIDYSSPEAPVPPTAKPFFIRVVGPKVATEILQATITSRLSRLPNGSPPERTLVFDAIAPANGVYEFKSKGILASKVPSLSHQVPTIPEHLGGSGVLAVEVAGLVDVRLTGGPLGLVTGQAEVSGLEVMAPREGSLLNVLATAEATIEYQDGFTPSGEPIQIPVPGVPDPRVGLALKWHGLPKLPQILLYQPDLDGGEVDGGLSNQLPSSAPNLTSVSANYLRPSGFGEHTYTAKGVDRDGNPFESESHVFTFFPFQVANDSLIENRLADPGAFQIDRGRYFLPSVIGAMELVYPSYSDAGVSDHLKKNGLRAIAYKRNGGAIVTAVRADGKDVFEPLVEEIANSPSVSNDATPPLDGQSVDGDLTFGDVKMAGFGPAFLLTYNEAATPRDWIAVKKRSDIIQKVRGQLGQHPAEGAVSYEYQHFYDPVKRTIVREIAFLGLMEGLGYVLRLLGGLVRAVELGEGAVVLTGGEVAGVVRVEEILEVSQIAASGADEVTGLITTASATTLLRPVLLGGVQTHQISGLSPTIAGLAGRLNIVRGAIKAARSGQYRELLRRGVQSRIGEEYGLAAGDDFVLALASREGKTLERICCGRRGPGNFDSAYVLRDSNGAEELLVLEAKGGQKYVNPFTESFDKGRKITVNGQPAVAVQGSPEYFNEIMRLMGGSGAIDEVAAFQRFQLVGRGRTRYFGSSARWTTVIPGRKARSRIVKLVEDVKFFEFGLTRTPQSQ